MPEDKLLNETNVLSSEIRATWGKINMLNNWIHVFLIGNMGDWMHDEFHSVESKCYRDSEKIWDEFDDNLTGVKREMECSRIEKKSQNHRNNVTNWMHRTFVISGTPIPDEHRDRLTRYFGLRDKIIAKDNVLRSTYMEKLQMRLDLENAASQQNSLIQDFANPNLEMGDHQSGDD